VPQDQRLGIGHLVAWLAWRALNVEQSINNLSTSG